MTLHGINNHEPLTERRMLEFLATGEIGIPGININMRNLEMSVSGAIKLDVQPDAIIDISWQSKTFAFLVECKARSTPKIIESAIGQSIYYSRLTGLYPMVFVPYLSSKELERLQAANVSGIDLCGNCIISVPGDMLIYKTGEPNKFPSRRKGPNPYRGASSIVARTLVMQPKFESSRSIESFIIQRGGKITQGTISKAIEELEEDQMISRQGRAIRVLQHDTLLDNLVRNFEGVSPGDTRSYKVNGLLTEVADTIKQRAFELDEDVVVTGIGSASHYTAMAQSPPLPVYCRRLDLLDGHADLDSRFSNIIIKRMDDAGAYYDTRLENGWPWASPVQSYIELQSGSARDREMADHVRRIILLDEIGTQDVFEREAIND